MALYQTCLGVSSAKAQVENASVWVKGSVTSHNQECARCHQASKPANYKAGSFIFRLLVLSRAYIFIHSYIEISQKLEEISALGKNSEQAIKYLLLGQDSNWPFSASTFTASTCTFIVSSLTATLTSHSLVPTFPSMRCHAATILDRLSSHSFTSASQ